MRWNIVSSVVTSHQPQQDKIAIFRFHTDEQHISKHGSDLFVLSVLKPLLE